MAQSYDMTEEYKFLKNLFNSIEEFVYCKDIELKYKYVNNAFCVFLGKSANEIIGKDAFALFSQTEAETISYSEKLLLITKEPCSAALLMTGKNGSRWINVDKQPLFDSENRLIGLKCIGKYPEKQNHPEDANAGIGVSIDAETNVDVNKEIDDIYNIFKKNASIMLLIDSGTGRIIDANLSAEDFYGYKKSQLTKMYIQDINTLTKEEVAKEIKSAIDEEKKYFVFSHRLAGGEIRIVEVHSTPIKIKNRSCLLSIVIDVTDRKYSEKALKDSEEKYRTIFNNTFEAIIIHDFAGKFLDVNNIACERYGYSREEFLRMTIWDVVPEKYRKKVSLRIESAIEKGYVYFQTVHVDHCGRLFPVEITTKSIEFEGKPAIIGSIRDISEGKRANNSLSDIFELNKSKEALKASDEKLSEQTAFLSALLNSIPEMVFTKDINGVFLGCNPEFARLLGNEIDNIVGKTDYDFFDKETADFFRKNDRLMLESDRPQTNEEWIKYPDGSSALFDTLKAPLKNAEGETIGILGVSRNITERKKSEELIRVLSLAVEQSPVSIIITDIKGNVHYANRKMLELTGYSLQEIKGKNPRILNSGIHSKEFYREMWDTILAGKVWSGEFYNKKKNGDFYWESATISGLLDDNGEIIQILAIKEDITEQKLLEKEQERLIEELVAANNTIEESMNKQNTLIVELTDTQEKLQKINDEKDKFFSIIAHDLRNPFVALINNSEMLEQYYDSMEDDLKLKLIADMKDASKYTYTLLENLLQWVRSQMGSIVYTPNDNNLSELLLITSSILKAQAAQKNIYLKVISDKTVNVFCDRDMIDTVLRNLVSNAIKFSPNGKEIIISADEYENGNIIIKVKDSGIGIPEQTKAKLFKLAENVVRKGTNNEKGTGLGLLLCKEFIEMNKGEIWVDSLENDGSTFSFTLPKTNN